MFVLAYMPPNQRLSPLDPGTRPFSQPPSVLPTVVCLFYIVIKLMIHIGLVPIYDVREIQNFRFMTASLNSLHQLPRFRKDKADPASNKYIASVGYALNSWSRSRNIGSDFCVTMNILFVIIVAKALEEEAV